MLIKLAVWYLRKRKRSVIIGIDLQGFAKSRNKHCLLYDNKLTDTEFRTYDNWPLMIPEGKFNIIRTNNN